MLKIALTGGIACGKSLVGSIAGKLGIEVCEADRLAHALIAPAQPAYREIVEAFGSAILDPDGSINRTRLGHLVFGNDQARVKLNAIVHPRVRAAWEQWMRERQARCAACMVIVPLLYEAGFESGWDAVVAVVSNRERQMERLRQRGLTEQAARQRLAAQLSPEEKARRADVVIENNGTEESVVERTRTVLQGILEN